MTTNLLEMNSVDTEGLAAKKAELIREMHPGYREQVSKKHSLGGSMVSLVPLAGERSLLTP